MHVCPFVLTEQLGLHWADFWNFDTFQQIPVKMGHNNTLHADLWTYILTSAPFGFTLYIYCVLSEVRARNGETVENQT